MIDSRGLLCSTRVHRAWIVVGVFLGLWSAVIAQEATSPATENKPSGAVEGAANQEAGAAPSATTEISFSRNREVEQGLERLTEKLQQQDWSGAAGLAASILERFDRTMVRLPGEQATFRPAREEVQRHLKEAPEAARRAYIAHVEPQAKVALLEAVAQQNPTALKRVGELYRFSPAGAEALETLAAWHWQQGQPSAAAGALAERIFQEADVAAVLRERPDLAVMYYRSLQEAPHRAEAFWQKHGTELLSAKLPQGGTVQQAYERYRRSTGLPLAADEIVSAHFWEHQFELGAAAAGEIQAGLQDLREHGLQPAPTWHACSAGSVWLVSHPTGISALDRSTGEPRWFLPHEWKSALLFQETEAPAEELQARMFRWELMVRMFGEATFNRLETDGDKLFYVIPEHAAGLFQLPVQGQQHPFPTQSLLCRKASTGEFLWSTQGGQFAPAYFIGPPVHDGQQLNILAETQRDGRMLLMGIDPASGEVNSVVELFRPTAPIADDFRRTNRAGMVIPLHSLLLCATCAGGLVAVDRSTRELRWFYQYPRDDLPRWTRRAMDPQTGQVQYHNWQGWSEVQCLATPDGSKLLFVTPDSQQLHCLNLETGQAAWTRSLPQGRQLAEVTETEVTVIESAMARRIRHEDSLDAAWPTIATPAGKGTWTTDRFLIPTADGWADDCHDSHPQANTLAVPRAPANLFYAQGNTIAVSHTGVRCLAAPAQEALVTDWSEVAVHVQSLIAGQSWELAFQVLQKGEPLAQALEQQPQAQELRWELDYHWAAQAGCGEIPPEELMFLREYGSDDQHLDLAVLELRQALERHSWERAANISAALWKLPLETEFRQHPLDRLVECRVDRLVAGLWQAQLRGRLRAPELRANNDEICQLLDQTCQTLIAEGVDRTLLAERLGQLPWGQKLRIETEPKWTTAAEFAKWELRLLDQVDQSAGELQKETLIRLVMLYVGRDEAIHWYRLYQDSRQGLQTELREPFAQLVREWEQNAPPAAPDLTPFAAWGTAAPTLEVKERLSSDIRFTGIPVRAERGTPASRLNVALDWPGGQGLQFSQARAGRPWRVSLGTNGRHLRADTSLAQAWGLGHQLLVQVGTELFGVSPFNAVGERRASVLWPQSGEPPVDTLGDRSVIMLGFAEVPQRQRPGFHTLPYRLVDDYQHEVGAVGPVHPGAIIIQQKGMLVALDPATGGVLWRRYDLPPLTQASGNARSVVVWGEGARTATLLRGTDGVALGQVPLPQHEGEMLLDLPQTADSSTDQIPVLFVQGEPALFAADVESTEPAPANVPLVFTACDLLNVEQPLWQRSWPPGSVPFEISPQWLGVCNPMGEVQLVDLAKGETVSQHDVQEVPELRQIITHIGESTVLIAFSGPPSKATTEGEATRRGNRKMINGPLLCLDRQTGAELWRTNVTDTLFERFQPVDLPVFVCVTPVPPPSGMPGQGTLDIYDRRTGKLLHQEPGMLPQWTFFTVSGVQAEGRVQVKTQHKLLEFHFENSERP